MIVFVNTLFLPMCASIFYVISILWLIGTVNVDVSLCGNGDDVLWRGLGELVLIFLWGLSWSCDDCVGLVIVLVILV